MPDNPYPNGPTPTEEGNMRNQCVFNAVRTFTTDPTFIGYVRKQATLAATTSYTRVSDISVQVAQNLEDLVQTITLQGAERILRYMDSADNYPIHADEVPDGHIAVQDGANTVIGWDVLIRVGCGECDGCGMGRRCTDPSYSPQYMTVKRIMFSVAKNVVLRTFRPDERFTTTYADDVELERACIPLDMYGMPITVRGATVADVDYDPIAPAIRRIVRKAARAAEEGGYDLIAANGKVATDAGNMVSMMVGHVPTPDGRRAAYAKLATMQAKYTEKLRNA